MVIQTNEEEFTGKTLQEYLDWKYPTKEDKEEVREIDVNDINWKRKRQGIIEWLEGGKLDLSEFSGLRRLGIFFVDIKTPLTEVDASNCEMLGKWEVRLEELEIVHFITNFFLGRESEPRTIRLSEKLRKRLSEKLRKMLEAKEKDYSKEKEFQGKTLQEYLEWKYPTKEDKEGVMKINIKKINWFRNKARTTERLAKINWEAEELILADDEENREVILDGGELNLKEFVNLEELFMVSYRFGDSEITDLDLSGCTNLKELKCQENNLTSVDFLNTLPNPEKLEILIIHSNNIQSTDISVFSRLVNLKELKIGTAKEHLQKGKHNKFYGSLKSYQNLTKLEKICIEATDINEGLEYLPLSLVQATKKGLFRFTRKEKGYWIIECSPHNTNAKCKAIQDQLRPFNYDLEAWQLANPDKMLIARPEYFTNPDSKDKWITALKNKVEQSKQELSETDREKLKRIIRLESKIQELEKAKNTISQQTQTDLTMEQIKQWEKENKQTWYEKVIEKFKKS